MDPDWLYKLTQDTAVIVPTRSLANSLNERLARYQIKNGASVWEAPNILLWQDYLRLLWQTNRECISQSTGSHTLISNQQSLLLWTQVIEASRRQERALTLLNVQQTARAVQRSWRLMHDWLLEPEVLQQDHVADTEQFLLWLRDYVQLLGKRGLLDNALLQQEVLQQQSQLPFARLRWHCYDLITAAHDAHNEFAVAQGVEVEFSGAAETAVAPTDYILYSDQKEELRGALLQARELIEQDPQQRINLVVPDLAQRQAQVRDLAAEVFYPAVSPLEVQLKPSVYRFSLGQPLHQWPAIETGLRVIKLLRNRCTVTELSFILRNQFLGVSQRHRAECRQFERWLTRQRVRFVLVDQLPDLYQQCLAYAETRGLAPQSPQLAEVLTRLATQRQAVASQLQEQQQEHTFAALTFRQWVAVFNDWLQAWGWHTALQHDSMDSVQYQLYRRWQSLLEEYLALGTVQARAGLSRALDILEQMTRDAVFLPKAVASPIFISGIFEAIGRPADLCLLTGMSQHYPPQPQADAFVPNRLLQNCGFPDATPAGAFEQAMKVNNSLFAHAEQVVVSYAQHTAREPEAICQPSPLFRQADFSRQSAPAWQAAVLEMETYQDTKGPPWPDISHASGGSQIFVNQSQCAFKAFATHQLQYSSEEEAEFGLDARERGSVVHKILQLAWQELGSQQTLLALSEDARSEFAARIAAAAIANPGLRLSADKVILLQREQPRLQNLLLAWLAVEVKRPTGFSVVECEQNYQGELAGVRFKFTIDRLDLSDDGRSLLVDYKTGSVAKKDWLGERIKQPQLPLYALELDSQKQTPLSGIAYALVQQPDPKYLALSEQQLVSKGTANSEQEWLDARATWPELFAQLAQQFKRGHAEVDPIDDQVCQYCEFKALCRVAQLQQLALGEDDVD